MKVAEDKIKLVEAQAETDKAKAVIEAKSKTVKEYKALSEFEAEVIESFLVAYGYSFDTCKAQVVHFFPEIDVN